MSCTVRGKTAVYLPPLVGLSASSDGINIDVRWNVNAPSYPTQKVLIAVRVKGSTSGFTVLAQVDRDDGIRVLDGTFILPDTDYTLWARPEDANYYAEWQGLVVRMEEDWTVGIEDVVHLGDTVTFSGGVVTSAL